MKKPTKQANFRLPEHLLEELQEVAETLDTTQTEIVKKGVERRIKEIKARLPKLEEAAANG